MDIRSLIRDVPDFPKPGILFRDITPLLQHPQGFRHTIESLAQKFSDQSLDYVLGIESRGFILGATLAHHLGKGFVPVRKPGKLPPQVLRQSYELEYGTDQLEVREGIFQPGDRVVIIDDLIATGGTAQAAGQLVQRAGAKLCGFGFVIELSFLGGRQMLPEVPVHSLVVFED